MTTYQGHACTNPLPGALWCPLVFLNWLWKGGRCWWPFGVVVKERMESSTCWIVVGWKPADCWLHYIVWVQRLTYKIQENDIPTQHGQFESLRTNDTPADTCQTSQVTSTRPRSLVKHHISHPLGPDPDLWQWHPKHQHHTTQHDHHDPQPPLQWQTFFI